MIRPAIPAFGVVLANLGTPDAPTARALRSYLRQFLSDPRVVDLPGWQWQPILNLFVLPFRPRRSARLYRRIWTAEGSPLLVTTRRIGRAMMARMAETRGIEVPVAVGMRYGSPSIADALRELEHCGCRRILVLPLFPQYSATTTASVFDAVAAGIAKHRPTPEVRTVRSYASHPAYVAALADSVRDFRSAQGDAGRLLISFHGIPRRYADAGDPYPGECAATARALAATLDLEPGRWHMAYQSRFGREPWLKPYLDLRLERWGRLGIGGIDLICPGFAADCLETLEEVAVAERGRFESAGGRDLRYIPALNDRPDHVAALVDIVIEHAAGWVD